MDFSVVFGFLLGVAAMLVAEGIVLYWILQKLTRTSKAKKMPVDSSGCDLNVEQRPIVFPYEKQGSIWILETDKLVTQQNTSQIKGTKEQKIKKDTIEVSPIKKHGKIIQHNLILTDPDGSYTTIQLLDCKVESVSASTLPSRKWVKKYPIRVQSLEKNIYNGSKFCYLYFETSWEKEAWCKALRLASYSTKEKINWYAGLSEEFHCYLASLSTVYPLLFKPSAVTSDFQTINTTDKVTDGNPSKFRYFFKKFAKKASKSSSEQKYLSSHKGEKKISEKNLQDHRARRPHHPTKSSSAEKSSSEDPLQPNFSTKNPPVEKSSSQEPAQLNSTFTNLESHSVHSLGDVSNKKSASESDQGAVFLNLLFSRLFFDIKRSMAIDNFIKERIQRILSHTRTPSYIGAITCMGIDLGNRPPYLRSIKALPIDMNEGWAVDVEIEYSGHFLIEIETRLDVRESEMQSSIVSRSNELGLGGDDTSDIIKESLNDYNQQFNSSSDSEGVDGPDDENKLDIMKQPKSVSFASRWRTVLKNVADHVSQVPLSLEVKVASLKGTIRLQIKPPPSDNMWIGFTTMPEIDFNLNSFIGDHKIASTHVAILISNRLKAAIRDTLVLPNCESVRFPFMVAETNDWIPRSAGPFVWVRQESGESSQKNASKSQSIDSKEICKSFQRSITTPVKIVESKENDGIRNATSLPPTLRESVSQFSSVMKSTSESSAEESRPIIEEVSMRKCSTSEDLGKLSMTNDEIHKTSSMSTVESLLLTTTSTDHLTVNSNEEDTKAKKMGKKERIKDFGKKMTEKFDEKIRHIEEKKRQIVENISNDAIQTLSFSKAEITITDNIQKPLLSNADNIEFQDNNSDSSTNSPEYEIKAKKTGREKIRDLRKKMSEKLEEKKKHIVVKMKEN